MGYASDFKSEGNEFDAHQSMQSIAYLYLILVFLFQTFSLVPFLLGKSVGQRTICVSLERKEMWEDVFLLGMSVDTIDELVPG